LPPSACRLEEVLDALAHEPRGAIEIDGDPRRLDREPRWSRSARDRGLSFVLSVDAGEIAASRSNTSRSNSLNGTEVSPSSSPSTRLRCGSSTTSGTR